jgi:hypothetical protein
VVGSLWPATSMGAPSDATGYHTLP